MWQSRLELQINPNQQLLGRVHPHLLPLPPAPQQVMLVVVPSAPAAATLTIPVGASTAGNPSYDPVSLTVKKGDEIDVVNKDSSPHTVTSGKTPDAPDAGKQFDTSIINAASIC